MDSRIKKSLRDTTKKVIKAIQKQDSFYLRNTSNYTLHNASVFQDQDSIGIAVITYALSKIMERPHKKIKDMPYFWKDIEKELKKMRLCIIRNDDKAYRKAIKDIFKKISRIDTKLALYIDEVINKARIKKGSKIYEHGISLARAAEILGISEWELMNYVGKTQIIDTEERLPSVRKRLDVVRGLFGLR